MPSTPSNFSPSKGVTFSDAEKTLPNSKGQGWRICILLKSSQKKIFASHFVSKPQASKTSPEVRYDRTPPNYAAKKTTKISSPQEVFTWMSRELHQHPSKSKSTWMSRWKLGSRVRINGLFHLLINGIYSIYELPGTSKSRSCIFHC